MLRALLKKQWIEMTTWLFVDKKTNKKRTLGSKILYIGLFAYCGVVFFVMFFTMAKVLCEPFVSLDLGWFYFLYFCFLSIAIGIIGSIFNTYATLYDAKDNDLLLALPIPAKYILFTRILSIWLYTLLYMSVVYIPAMVVYAMTKFSFGALICQILVLLALSLFDLAIALILGYLIARLMRKVKNKSLMTVLFSLVFLGLYFWGYSRSFELVSQLLQNALFIGEKVKGAAYPLYLLGMAQLGKFIETLGVIAICLILFIAVYMVLMKSFFKLVINKGPGVAKTEYKKEHLKTSSVSKALLNKEFKRYLASPTYILNCSLGSIMILVGAVGLVLKADTIKEMLVELEAMGGHDLILLMICGALCLSASMNDLTAPSVSLEGKSFWITKSLPVDTWEIFKAKINLHLIITCIPLFVLTLAVFFVYSPTILEAVILIVIPQMFVLVTALFGLVINLFFPNLHWTNEVYPVKQGMGVMIALFGNMIIIMMLVFLYYLIQDYVSPMVFMGVVGIIFVISIIGMLHFLKTKGKEIYAKLD